MDKREDWSFVYPNENETQTAYLLKGKIEHSSCYSCFHAILLQLRFQL